MLLWFAGTLVALVGLVLTYLRWRNSGSHVVMDCELVGPADKPYSPPHHPPHYRVRLSNTGRTSVSVVEVAVLTRAGWAFAKPGGVVGSDMKDVVYCRGCAIGPALPTTLESGRTASWSFPSVSVSSGIAQIQAWLGTGEIEIVQKAIEELPKGGFAIFKAE